MPLRVLVINDCMGEGSSYYNLVGIQKHSKHDIRINMWQGTEEDLEWCDLAYIHYGGIGEWYDLHEQLKYRRDLNWILGIRGNTNFKRITFRRNKKRVVVWYARLCDAYSCANKEIMRRVSEYDNKPAYLCTAGADPEVFTPRPRPEEFTVGWVGKYLPGVKGTDKLLDLDYKVLFSHEFPQTRFKWIPHELMPTFYETLSVLAVSSDREGSPMPPIEAGMMKIPVVATRCGNLEDWMPDELLVPTDFQPKEMNDILKKLETDEAFYTWASNRCYEGAMRYTFENVAKEYDVMFDEVYRE